MAMKFIDMTGKTEDEAIKKALAELGLERDDVSVEILERAKSGFFGIGASPAKVRVTYGLEEEVAAPKKAEPAKASVKAPAKAPEKAPEKVDEADKPAKAEKVEKVEKTEKPEKAEKPEKGERSRRRRGDKSKGEKKEAVEAAPAVVIEPEDLGEPCNDEKAQQITAFLTGLLQHMDSEAQVKVYQTEKGRYKVILEGDKLGQLIGRRGETLDSIQQLTNYSVNRGSDKRVRVHVDAENYREKREQSLQNLALKVAAKVVKYRKNVTLEPMNAYERHVIHTALQEYDHVTTYSMGTEPNRRVVVAYER